MKNLKFHLAKVNFHQMAFRLFVIFCTYDGGSRASQGDGWPASQVDGEPASQVEENGEFMALGA